VKTFVFFQTFQNKVDVPYAVHHDMAAALNDTLVFLIMFLCGDSNPIAMFQRSTQNNFLKIYVNPDEMHSQNNRI